jgi:hypothetical protein
MNVLLALLLAVAPDVPRDAPGTWADPARGVSLVPGARTLLSGFSAASFDGLPFDSTTYWYDGVKLELPAHALFGPTTLHPAWVEGVRVRDAVDSVEYGRTLGRRVELLPRGVEPERPHGVARLDVLQAGLYAENLFDQTGTTVQLSGRFFAIPAIVASALKIRALLADWQLRLVQPLERGEFRALILGAYDNAALSVSGIPIEARLQSHQVDLRWRRDAEGSFELGAGVGSKSVGLSLNGAHTQNSIDGLEQSAGFRALGRPALGKNVTLSLGGDLGFRRLVLARSVKTQLPDVGTQAQPQATSAQQQELGIAVLGGAHTELTIVDGASVWSLGVRADVWGPADASPFVTFDPRVQYLVDDGGTFRFEAGLGLKHQPASWLVAVPVLDTAAWRFGMQEAALLDAALTVRPYPGHAVRLRGFGAILLSALELSPFDADFLQEVTFAPDALERRKGSGWAAGAELSWRFFDNGWLWGQAAYSLQASWRKDRVTRFDGFGLPTGEVEAPHPWAYQQLHAWTAAGGLRTRNGWSLGVALCLQTGPQMVGGLFAQEQQPGTDALTGAPKWVPKDADRVGSAGPWFRLDARVSKTWRPGAAEVELFLDVQNLSIWAQPTGRSYSTVPTTLQSQAAGEVMLTSKPSSSVLPGPLPVLGLEARL